MLAQTLRHLEQLVAFDTRNPPRRIDEAGIFEYLRAQLEGFHIELNDHGAGALSMLAVRGQTQRLFNVHLDTVPDSPQWTASPHRLRVSTDRAIGLGACDIKGAAACMLSAASATTGPAAFLFSTDEEANDARCVPAFVRSGRGFAQVVVAEPTGCEAVIAHRGISSVLIRFRGAAGHASEAHAVDSSAVHRLVAWGQRALDCVASMQHERFGGMAGLRFNIGRVEGGIKANMIADAAELRFGFRPLPSMNVDVLHQQFRDLIDAEQLAHYEETFRGPALPAGANVEADRSAAIALADDLGMTVGPVVDFWTEAALFSQAGLTAIVFGPGHIAQAHSADEWVALDQLEVATATYKRLFAAL